jgi:hypothetical protein
MDRMLLVKRGDFMAWVFGELINRDGESKVTIGDHIDHERAEEAMKNGETIGLTNQGILISKMKLVEDKGFIEFQDEECIKAIKNKA